MEEVSIEKATEIKAFFRKERSDVVDGHMGLLTLAANGLASVVGVGPLDLKVMPHCLSNEAPAFGKARF